MTVSSFRYYMEKCASKIIPYDANLLKLGGLVDADGHIILCRNGCTVDELAKEYCLGSIPPESLMWIITVASESYSHDLQVNRNKSHAKGKHKKKENEDAAGTILTPCQRIESAIKTAGSKLSVDSILLLSQWITTFGISNDTFSSFLICIMGFDIVSLDSSGVLVQTISEFYTKRFREYIHRNMISVENIKIVSAMDETQGFEYIDPSTFRGATIDGIRNAVGDNAILDGGPHRNSRGKRFI